MNEWTIALLIIVTGLVVLMVAQMVSGHREKMAEMMMEAWGKTLDQPPLGAFTRSGVHPIPDLLGHGRIPSPRLPKFKGRAPMPPMPMDETEPDEPQEMPQDRPKNAPWPEQR